MNGVILLSYGSPENLDEMGDFLTHIRHGKSLPPEVVAQFRSRYEQTGGPSPLNRITRAQAQALHEEFQKLGQTIETFVGMAHCKPWIREGVQSAREKEIEHLVGLPMAPHFSSLSTGKYKRFFEQALTDEGFSGNHSFIDYWYSEGKIADFFVREILSNLKHFQGKPLVLFTAHSLPERILAERDPYPDQIRENAQWIANRSGLKPDQWRIAYQSKGLGAEPWLGPSVEVAVGDLAREGFKQVLLCPMGFCADHIEILYDLDIALCQQAKDLGIETFRTQSLNTNPSFISALAQKVLDHLNHG